MGKMAAVTVKGGGSVFEAGSASAPVVKIDGKGVTEFAAVEQVAFVVVVVAADQTKLIPQVSPTAFITKHEN